MLCLSWGSDTIYFHYLFSVIARLLSLICILVVCILDSMMFLICIFFLFVSSGTSLSDNTYGLIIGGQCSHAGNICNYVEKISPTSVCEVDIPPPPIHSQEAEAVFFQEKIWLCGGANNTQLLGTNYCLSYHLGGGEEEWVVEKSMVMERMMFSMSVVGDKLYAAGGHGYGWPDDEHPEVEHSVEVFTPGEGWKVVDNMRMESARVGPCSVALNDDTLVVIGGKNGGVNRTNLLKSSF